MRLVVLVLVLCAAISCRRVEAPAPRADAPCGPPKQASDLVVLDSAGRPNHTANEQVIAGAGVQRVLICSRVRSARHGRVVEEGTGAGIANATVIVESWQTAAPIGGRHPERRLLRSVEVKSDVTGEWAVNDEWAWLQGYLAADGFPTLVDSECARAPGYAPYVFDPWEQPEDYFVKPPSSIALNKSSSLQGVTTASTRVSACGIALGPALK
jgi:hypothetical protein